MSGRPVTLDLPPPPSVNRVRKIDRAAVRMVRRWEHAADQHVLAAKVRSVDPVRLQRIPRFELLVVMSEDLSDADLDNNLKSLIDYLHRIELVANDAKKNMRRIVIEWGLAPEGCRVTVTPREN